MKEKYLIQTQDKSPSYEVVFSSGKKESMHNRKGALKESLYIYYTAIEKTKSLGLEPSYLSVGLGLGYNEMILAASSQDESFSCVSLEKDPHLKKDFQTWLGASLDPYDEIATSIASHFHTSKESLKNSLRNQLLLKGELSCNTKFISKFSCIFYDLFSSQTQPEFWSEEFLEDFIEKTCLEKCVFATYAATGSLKRALKKKNFHLIDRKGFEGKRESCLAIRS